MMQQVLRDESQIKPAPYDGGCPLCQIGANKNLLDEQYAELHFEDIRGNSAPKDEAIAYGKNRDRDVVQKSGDNLSSISDTAQHIRAPAGTHKRLQFPLPGVARQFLLWLTRVPEIHEEGAGRKQSTIKTQMGDDWANLHRNVRQRFATEPTVREQVFYRGTMDTVECSFAGKIFAQLTRLIANPPTPYEGKNVHMDVTLYRKTGLAGVYWRRTYFFAGRTPYTVTSVKREDNKGQMTECVGAGFCTASRL